MWCVMIAVFLIRTSSQVSSDALWLIETFGRGRLPRPPPQLTYTGYLLTSAPAEPEAAPAALAATEYLVALPSHTQRDTQRGADGQWVFFCTA